MQPDWEKIMEAYAAKGINKPSIAEFCKIHGISPTALYRRIHNSGIKTTASKIAAEKPPPRETTIVKKWTLEEQVTYYYDKYGEINAVINKLRFRFSVTDILAAVGQFYSARAKGIPDLEDQVEFTMFNKEPKEPAFMDENRYGTPEYDYEAVKKEDTRTAKLKL